jgi:hypothetical protein
MLPQFAPAIHAPARFLHGYATLHLVLRLHRERHAGSLQVAGHVHDSIWESEYHMASNRSTGKKSASGSAGSSRERSGQSSGTNAGNVRRDEEGKFTEGTRSENRAGDRSSREESSSRSGGGSSRGSRTEDE